MTNPNDPAFHVGDAVDGVNEGLTKREYFAAIAEPSWNAVMELLQAAGIKNPSLEQKLEARAALRVMEADALIASLNKEPKS